MTSRAPGHSTVTTDECYNCGGTKAEGTCICTSDVPWPATVKRKDGIPRSCEEVRAALAAKDAEIERLREQCLFYESVLDTIATAEVASVKGLQNAAELGLEEYGCTPAPETPQEPRSGVSAHGEPSDTPTGDTR